VHVSGDPAKARDQLQRTMIEGAGVVRSADSLARSRAAIDAIAEDLGPEVDRASGELANLVTAATSLLGSAALRNETRGAHARSDYPEPDDRWRRRIVHVGAGDDFADGASGARR
jgi:L-aspartate oxidase